MLGSEPGQGTWASLGTPAGTPGGLTECQKRGDFTCPEEETGGQLFVPRAAT